MTVKITKLTIVKDDQTKVVDVLILKIAAVDDLKMKTIVVDGLILKMTAVDDQKTIVVDDQNLKTTVVGDLIKEADDQIMKAVFQMGTLQPINRRSRFI